MDEEGPRPAAKHTLWSTALTRHTAYVTRIPSHGRTAVGTVRR